MRCGIIQLETKISKTNYRSWVIAFDFLHWFDYNKRKDGVEGELVDHLRIE
jgi:hypothetical protein